MHGINIPSLIFFAVNAFSPNNHQLKQMRALRQSIDEWIKLKEDTVQLLDVDSDVLEAIELLSNRIKRDIKQTRRHSAMCERVFLVALFLFLAFSGYFVFAAFNLLVEFMAG